MAKTNIYIMQHNGALYSWSVLGTEWRDMNGHTNEAGDDEYIHYVDYTPFKLETALKFPQPNTSGARVRMIIAIEGYRKKEKMKDYINKL